MTANGLLSWYVEFSHAAATLAANVLVQSTLIVGAGLVAARALRRRGAAVQSSVLRVTLVAVLFCPLASWLLGAGGISGFRITLPTTLPRDRNVHPAASASADHPCAGQSSSPWSTDRTTDSAGDSRDAEGRLGSAVGIRGRSGEGRPGGTAGGREGRDFGSVVAPGGVTSAEGGSGLPSSFGRLDALAMAYGSLTAVWLVVASFLAVRLAVAYRLMCAARRSARPAGQRLKAQCRAAADALSIRPPRVLVSCRVSNPCLVGWWRPAILLPSDGEEIHRQVLVHELAHLARGDSLWNLASRLAALVLFFQPLLSALRRRLAQAAEEVCDDYVVAHSADRASYARQLVDIAERLQPEWSAQTAGVGVVSFRSSLSRRIRRILDTSRGLSIRTGSGALFAIAMVGLCASVLIGLIGAEGKSVIAAVPEQAAADPDGRAVARADTEGAETEEKPTSRGISDGRRIVFQGRVLGPDGQPFAGANLYVRTSYDSDVSGKPPARATTAADGAFRFEIAKSEFDPRFQEEYVRNVRVFAAAEGYGPDWAKRDEDGQFTLRLVKDDVPIRGRLVDPEGKPVAGVTVKVIQLKTTPQEDLGPWVEASKTAREANPLEYELLRKYASAGTFGHLLPPVTTGRDGTFVLKGVGRERMVTLRIEGPGIETCLIHAMTRSAERVAIPEYERSPSLGTSIYYGATFEHQMAPDRPIVGVVRDKDTGKPLAGVTLRIAQGLGGASVVEWVETTSDAEGKYRLAGLPRRKDTRILAIPPDDQPYLLSELKVEEAAGRDEARLDFALKRGIWIEGKVTDKITGKPVKAAVFYYAFWDNPHAKEAPGLRGASRGWIAPYYVAGEGSFRRVGLPGRGLIAVREMEEPRGGYRMGIGASQIKEGWSDDGLELLRTIPYYCAPVNFNAVAEIHPREDQDRYQCNVSLDPGRTLAGEVLDPSGEPLAGVRMAGQTEFATWAHFPLETSTFTVKAYDPSKPRLLSFVHSQRRLAGSLPVEGDDPGRLTVRLKPWATVTGRVLDAEGAPKAGVILRGLFGKKWDVLTTGMLPPDKSTSSPGKVYTNDDGRFRIEGLIPGLKYNIAVEEMLPGRSHPTFTGQIVFDLILEPGETKHLGDVPLRPLADSERR